MSAELIYKTTSPAAIAWWKNAEKLRGKEAELHKAFQDRMTALYGPAPGKEGRAIWHRGAYIMGIDSGSNEKPPVDSGWRLDSKERIWMPALAKATGKKLRAELDAMVLFDIRAHLPEIGVPQLAFADHHMYRAGMEFDQDEGAIYQIWGSGRCADECAAAAAKVPDVEWVKVPRSAWYAREEAKAVAE
jgi:hypothetical protein